MDTYIQQAFNQICDQAKQTESWYLVLMESNPYYGGPEEGGWWGRDTQVVAFQEFPTEQLAIASKDSVTKLAKELADQARRDYGNQCLIELDWLEARGLPADFLPEPDGPSEYYVIVVQEIPQSTRGTRQYS